MINLVIMSDKKVNDLWRTDISMEINILWSTLIIGIALFFYSLRKPPIKDFIIIFLLTSYFSIFLGVIVVEEKMIEYPISFLSNYFSSSLFYEYLLLPVVCIYFYQATYDSRYPSIILKCALYTSVLTIIEVFLERYTDLIEYHTWTWLHTFISIFFLMLFIRILMKFINKYDRSTFKKTWFSWRYHFKKVKGWMQGDLVTSIIIS